MQFHYLCSKKIDLALYLPCVFQQCTEALLNGMRSMYEKRILCNCGYVDNRLANRANYLRGCWIC